MQIVITVIEADGTEQRYGRVVETNGGHSTLERWTLPGRDKAGDLPLIPSSLEET